jgi:hypothetical protein
MYALEMGSLVSGAGQLCVDARYSPQRTLRGKALLVSGRRFGGTTPIVSSCDVHGSNVR